MEGQIWPSELIDRACGAPPVGDRTGYLLAVDYAHSSSVTHALLLARCGEEMWVLGEWRHDAKKRGQLSEPEQAERIVTHLVAGHPGRARRRRPFRPGDARRAGGRSQPSRLAARWLTSCRGSPAGASAHGRGPSQRINREGLLALGAGDARVRVGRTLGQGRRGQAGEARMIMVVTRSGTLYTRGASRHRPP